MKQVFTGDPGVFHAGEANATVLGDALGDNSLLTLDEGRHCRSASCDRCLPSSSVSSELSPRPSPSTVAFASPAWKTPGLR